jgi:hypothetical protein
LSLRLRKIYGSAKLSSVQVEAKHARVKQTNISPKTVGKKSRSLLDKLAKRAPNKSDDRITLVLRVRLTINNCDGVEYERRQLSRAGLERVIPVIGNGKVRICAATYRTKSAQSHAPSAPSRPDRCLNFTTYNIFPSPFGCVGFTDAIHAVR